MGWPVAGEAARPDLGERKLASLGSGLARPLLLARVQLFEALQISCPLLRDDSHWQVGIGFLTAHLVL